MPDHRHLPLHIAIDGPVASGKSVVSAALAQRLGILYLDTGLMYRSVALIALEHHIDLPLAHRFDPERQLDRELNDRCGALAEDLDLHIVQPTIDDGRQFTVLIGGRDVTWDIRSDAVNRVVSRVSSFPRVRAAMRARQRFLASTQPIIMAGRDIASVVLPDAQVKIMLDASLDERVRRRAEEMQHRQPDIPLDLAILRAEIIRRDAEDSVQMRIMPDTVPLQTDGLSITEVVDRILEVIHERYQP
jgi:CMP/dCMP kinase